MSHYRDYWNYYAGANEPRSDYWPGDEWGAPDTWARVFQHLFIAHGVTNWTKCVEIGAGSGKYTIKVLESSRAEILAADVSAAYQSHFCARLDQAGLLDRVTPLILGNESRVLRRAIEAKGWDGALDAFYSIDAMVHVDLQHLIAYFITAAATLRPGGKLIMTLANCCSDAGFEKLIRDVPDEFARAGQLTAKFEWMAPDQVNVILPKLGFSIDLLRTQGRDMWLVATLATPLRDLRLLGAIA